MSHRGTCFRQNARGTSMRNEFTAIVDRDEEWFIAYCPEVPGANGQGKTKVEARDSLTEAIALMSKDGREHSAKATHRLPKGAFATEELAVMDGVDPVDPEAALAWMTGTGPDPWPGQSH